MDKQPDDKQEAAENNNASEERYGFGSLVKALLAGAIGVNSDKNREKDFQQGRLLHFVIGGIVFTLLFILTIATIVGLVLGNAN